MEKLIFDTPYPSFGELELSEYISLYHNLENCSRSVTQNSSAASRPVLLECVTFSDKFDSAQSVGALL